MWSRCAELASRDAGMVNLDATTASWSEWFWRMNGQASSCLVSTCPGLQNPHICWDAHLTAFSSLLPRAMNSYLSEPFATLSWNSVD